MNSHQIRRAGLFLLAVLPAVGYALVRSNALPVTGAFVSPPTHVLAVGTLNRACDILGPNLAEHPEWCTMRGR